MAKVSNYPSAQTYLSIDQIRDGVALLKDGGMRAVLIVSSINFSLKSDEEQEAIIQSYISFLNSLDFSLEVVINSRRLNIDDYISRLEEQEKKLANDLLRTQIQEYRDFIKELITLGDIMAKRFFVVVPFAPQESKKKKGFKAGFFKQLQKVFSSSLTIKLKEEEFHNYREQLLRRVDYVKSGLVSMGLTAEMLDTQSLIELFYASYNPEISEVQKLSQISELQVE